MQHQIAIAIHGGAGTILKSQMSAAMEKEYTKGLEIALHQGYSLLEKGASALEAVIAATVALEDNPLFNAGKGSVFTHEGLHEMDAAVMCGDTLKAGAVGCVRQIRNPVLAAKAVMEKSEHVFLAGEGAEEFAKLNGLQFEKPEYFYTDHRYAQLQKAKAAGTVDLDHSGKKFGTVGAVAVDIYKNVAAATSTGGMTNKRYQRIGDSPVIGAGTYANNKTCAVSCTGHGEYFLRLVAAYDVSCLMEYRGLSLAEACHEVIYKKLPLSGGDGGLIAVDCNGNVALPFCSEGMYRGFMKGSGERLMAIFKEESGPGTWESGL